ncbi:MAG: pyrimidine dimer DNA glycosylase/endonuclease V [Cyclobacteriaceae bacterium]|nr:pyrimidine dimer DNA glycosylase/endonuclease V [Cyclobacteriaceae bacterium]
MRLWSIHPHYLDAKGLVALWRESLLAAHVLRGETKGYQNHPQLIRFREAEMPIDCINQYLSGIYEEALRRGYHFDKSKIASAFSESSLKVTSGQLCYEWAHLCKKVKVRDPAKFAILTSIDRIDPHPLFQVVTGEVEQWEIVRS